MLLGGFALYRVAAPVVRQVEGAVKGATSAAFGSRPTTSSPKSTGAKPTYGAPTAPVPKEQQPDAPAPETVPNDPASVAARASAAATYAAQGGSAFHDTAGEGADAASATPTDATTAGDAYAASVGG